MDYFSPTPHPVTNFELEPGATLAVIAPGGAIRPEKLELGIALLKEWGFLVKEGGGLRKRHQYFAGQTIERSADLNWALSDKSVDAVWLARGGYGTAHCLPAILDCAAQPGRPIVGSSDGTALFSALVSLGYHRLIHGPVLETLKNSTDEKSRAALKQLLSRGRLPELSGRYFCGPRKDITGRLIGGNLAVLTSLIGTKWLPSPNETILMLEDINEPAYKIDRYLTQLEMAGFLTNVSAIALGQLINCQPGGEESYTLSQMLLNRLEPLNIPVFFDFPCGHGKKNMPWLFGEVYNLENGRLIHVAHNPILG